MSVSWRVYVKDNDFETNLSLYIIEDRDGRLFSMHDGVGGNHILTEIKDGETSVNVPCLMRLPRHLAKTVFPAIIDGLSQAGFEKPSESFLKGRCDAMSLHLSDMRKLLKLSDAV